MKYPAYPKYKPSGVEWLGEVPEGWKVNRLKWSVKACLNGIWGDEPDGDDDITCVRVADFDRTRFTVVSDPPTKRSVEPSKLVSRRLQVGDLLLENPEEENNSSLDVLLTFAWIEKRSVLTSLLECH